MTKHIKERKQITADEAMQPYFVKMVAFPEPPVVVVVCADLSERLFQRAHPTINIPLSKSTYAM